MASAVARELTVMWPSNARSRQGFTLIELMIVVAILAIIIMVAYPSYRDQVVKTRRAEGKAVLASAEARMERCFTRFSAYNNAACTGIFPLTSENGWYQVTTSAIGATSYSLAAAPQKSQATDDTHCGTLTVTSTGIRGQSGSGTDCW